MNQQERIAHHKETVYQLCKCGGKLNRMDVEDHAGVCYFCRKDEK